ncbi:glycosyl transferase [Tepidibacter formicigenes]|uniref:UDP-N-acetylmuramyl pentapeptide phosphotransferase/UDP-N-acetylglucosamine-1-phosphate transferase n=1 Tax=Tepidibacter formicigenes DSM 15518 TaxID=1123349 RepID=A0A1M6L196_9FIRM|nr:glycosyl transferase [Tepidibacter formicigenes]SHJ64967.1 UDP-N-acetylmuramyl pentapeptide phosphotransferase/UDP-N-acetylglucosamine-1-phosphate transferase [Tepidibacter formicigenes DSM 15518]
MIYILFLIGFLGTLLIIPYFKSLLVESNIVRKNYKGDLIPVSIGIVFLPMLIVNSSIVRYFYKDNQIYIFLFGIIAMAFIGIIDDLIGNRDVSGLKGHFKSLFKGRLTTGGFKALFGGFVALFVSMSISNNIIDIIINTLLISLFTNLINLLDLRPGRAIKGYVLISLILLFTVSLYYQKILIILLLSNVLAYFKDDLKAKAMMGDVGSNVLGISIGIIVASNFSFIARSITLILLILIHIITEKYSLTKIIEKNKILNYIDMIGR